MEGCPWDGWREFGKAHIQCFYCRKGVEDMACYALGYVLYEIRRLFHFFFYYFVNCCIVYCSLQIVLAECSLIGGQMHRYAHKIFSSHDTLLLHATMKGVETDI